MHAQSFRNNNIITIRKSCQFVHMDGANIGVVIHDSAVANKATASTNCNRYANIHLAIFPKLPSL